MSSRDPSTVTTGRAPADLTELLELQRTVCRSLGSEVYDRLLRATIMQLERPGPVRELLLPHADDPFGSALALRFLGAVHRLVLDGSAPDLAHHYPSVGGTPGPGLEQAFEAVVGDHQVSLAEGIEAGIQTNEVGRSAALAGGLLEVARAGMPLRVLEIGASAGLNLRWDRYRYEAGGAAFGPPDSPVRFVDPWVDRHPRLDVAVDVIERAGCDRSPIDATTAEGRLLLRSFVWPDLTDRLHRLDRAIEVAVLEPAPVERADAARWLAGKLALPAAGTATVVVHSIVLQYLAAETQMAVHAAITEAGARATLHAPVAWVRMEPGRDGAEVRSTAWPGGADRLLAVSAYHGPPVRWVA